LLALSATPNFIWQASQAEFVNGMNEPEYSPLLDLPSRPRRNRKSEAVRGLVAETRLDPAQLILPLFVQEGSEDSPIASMPGCTRWSVSGVLGEMEEALALGIRSFVFFPKVPDSQKSSGAEEAWQEAGLIPRVLRAARERFPEACLITDVALDPYNADGHDGLVSPSGEILNDATVEALCRQAVMQARAGADIVSPSDMMDGRVGEIRRALDEAGLQNTSILSYTAKYASAFYGPFRGALDSAPRAGDKKTYQMDPANAREAEREAALDEVEGADILMVKPAGAYLDIIYRLRQCTPLPLAAYQVSGEYLMLTSAAAAGWLNLDAAILESLLGIRRAGADMILTYFAKRAAKLIRSAY
jgi:porphobilinogen synthase